ncbi:1-acyl-sn-glycerol-3-phosphate acyltransferase beta [Betta splendens]|uniref:1-acyl-sn-glycerol-3-phosphate acyltransferase n=1 Tax=Betta splendens TaxID=158456 RepID=A0A6P7P513_BETSP|nr:1-acyl-sn-glycerol-3-phosphate acyltransferase beta [Betta splendens]
MCIRSSRSSALPSPGCPTGKLPAVREGVRAAVGPPAPWLTAAVRVSGVLVHTACCRWPRRLSGNGGFAMDALWMVPLLLLPLLMWGSSAFVFYFKKFFYVAWMMVLALVSIPLCILKSGGRDVENMRIIRFMVRHVKYFLGLRFEVSGWEHLQTEGPYVIISNHQSSLDVLGLMEILPDRCTMIAKKELIYAGTVGLICWLGGIVFINRKKTSDAKSVMADAAKTMLDEQIRLWVFPEGTRNQKGDLLPFKKGAFHLAVQAQVPIIPVVFSSYSNFYLRKEKQFKSGTIRLKILPKIETKGMTCNDVSSLSEKSFNLMRSVFLDMSDSVTQSNGPMRH